VRYVALIVTGNGIGRKCSSDARREEGTKEISESQEESPFEGDLGEGQEGREAQTSLA